MRSCCLCLIVLCLLVGITAPSLAETASDDARTMIVLDASGSMWGQIDGKAKIVIAREVIAGLLKGWDADMPLGLTVYGHRREGDCADIETVIPVGQGTAGEIIRTINAVKPKGKTPLCDAVRHAARAMRYVEQRATVVLISDGVETCGADPCEVGAELSMGGFDFTAHVIGFDLKDGEQIGLRCLAENTGGLFLAAADAAGLRSALAAAMDEVKEPPPPVVDPGEASLTAPVTVPAGTVFEAGWEGPDSRGDYITIVKEDAADSAYLNYAYTKLGSPARITAPDQPGLYQLRYVYGHQAKVLARAGITVTPVTAEVKPPAQVAAGAYFQVPWTGPDNEGDYITIVLPDADRSAYSSYGYTSSGSPAKIQAPAEEGAYEVRYIMGRSKTVLAQAGVTVTAVSGSVEAPESVAAGSSILVHWTGPDNPGDYITIVPPDAEESEYLGYAYTSSGDPAKIQAPAEPGAYEVRYILDQNKTALARAGIAVTPVSGSVEAPGKVAAGSSFLVHWTGPDYPGDYITIVPPDAAESDYATYAYTSTGDPVSIQAPNEPGIYEVRYILDQNRKALARTEVTVE